MTIIEYVEHDLSEGRGRMTEEICPSCGCVICNRRVLHTNVTLRVQLECWGKGSRGKGVKGSRGQGVEGSRGRGVEGSRGQGVKGSRGRGVKG